MGAINFLEICFIFVLGSIFGSFFNVLLLRKNTGESAVSAPSRCFSCGHRLSAADLIPVLSFALLRGRCRYCGSKVSWQYPLVEAFIGLLAVLVYLKISPDASFLFFNKEVADPRLLSNRGNSQFLIQYSLFAWYFASFSALFLVAAYDFKTKIIDPHFLRVFVAFAAGEFLFRNWTAGAWASDLVSSFSIALFFYLMWRLSGGRWMGRGDTDLAFFTSLFLGFPLNIAGFFFSFWVGGTVGIFLLLFFKKFGPKSEIPFGPFLALGAALAWYFADAIAGFYGIIW